MTGQFLEGIQLRTAQSAVDRFEPVGLALGQGSQALEVLVVEASRPPSDGQIRQAWAERNNGRAAPLLLVVLLPGAQCVICGPGGVTPPITPRVDQGQADRLCRAALACPERHSARQLLQQLLPTLQQKVPGLRNEGLFATHELLDGAPQLEGWRSARDKSSSLLGLKGRELLAGLEFELKNTDRLVNYLYAKGKRRAAAVFLDAEEAPETDLDRFSGQSPVAYALHVADREGLPFVVVAQEGRLRLYPTGIDVGVGRRGRTETYVELHTDVLSQESAAYLWLLFSADALCEDGTVEQLLADSERYAGNLAENLRDRIYHRVVPTLAAALIDALELKNPSEAELARAYEMTMLVLFRLLFIGYAEDKDLLPFRWNEAYRARSLTQKARELLRMEEEGGHFDRDDSLWQETLRIFEAIDKGKSEWGIPVYNGGLFAAEPDIAPAGYQLGKMSLPNDAYGPVLRDLLLMETSEGLGAVDFRSLSVREFGTIYEGLLESELAAAPQDLTIDRDGNYKPAHEGDSIMVAAGEVFLHHRSGQRKSTGSYFTPPYIVDHLLDLSLEPALARHLERVAELDDDAAGRALFDFRVADIAMGSGHFLISAIDRIERAFSGFLAERNLSSVRQELASLKQAARKHLGRLEEEMPIEDGQLLRRLIARRCVYGVDLNPVAVQLARLAVWVHTFVPGLPLSLLDHNLVCGNSLVGIGRVSEIRDTLAGDKHDLFSVSAHTLVGDALDSLNKLGRAADASATELERARAAHDAARKATKPAKHLCDVVCAARMAGEQPGLPAGNWQEIRDDMKTLAENYRAVARLAPLNPLHFPVAFPEVFLRERAGFDVILGNPPWEEATVEEDAFWARHQPGLRSLPQREQEALKAQLRESRPDMVQQLEAEQRDAKELRRALVAGPYPGMGKGDPDLYKAFCWRFLELLADNGHFGVVLPRSALVAKGSGDFRDRLFATAGRITATMLINNKQWIFPEVHPQYTIGLFCIEKERREESRLEMRGPFNSRDRFEKGAATPGRQFEIDAVRSWTDTCALPLLPDEGSLDIFATMRAHPRLEHDDGQSWMVRAATEFHATSDKKHFDMESRDCPDGFWPVYKGASFDLWRNDTGHHYGWADPETVLPVLQQKRERASRNRRSAFSLMPKKWIEDEGTLPCRHPRIAFRDISRSTDTRTMRCNLIPPNVVCTNKAPYLLWPRGNEKDQSYLLGILSSIPFDWFSRRFVENTLNYHIVYPLPVPRPEVDDPLRVELIATSGRLASVDERYADWADAVGVNHGALSEDEHERMIHRVDALSAHLYGLNENQLRHLFATFHEGWSFEPRLNAVLKQYREIATEVEA